MIRMKRLFYALLLSFSILSAGQVSAQVIDEMGDESKLYASTKLVNQFFRRFNGEEDEKGERYYEGNKNFHDPAIRRRYIGILFDNQNTMIPASLKKEFAQEMTDKSGQKFLDFHSGNWMAEVNALFTYQGKEQPVTLFMKLQPQRLGYEWVIEEVYFEPFKKYFHKDTTATKKFLHPMSHELDFMNLRKAFQESENPESYTPDEFAPSYLTLFLYEMKRGNLKFKTVRDVKFHFFQINNWYFEVSQFNRSGYNSGWLISNIVKTSEENKKAIKNYLYGKN